MARLRIKLQHERQMIGLRAARTQHRIRIQDSKDKIAEIDSKLKQMRPKKPNVSDLA